MAKKPKNPRGIGARRKDEKAYSQAIKKDILDPLFTKIKKRIDSGPQIKAAYARAVNEEIAIMAATPDFGLATASVALDNIRKVHKANMIKSFVAALGVDVSPLMSDLNIRPLMVKALFDNVELIKSIPKNLNIQLIGSFEQIYREKGFDQHAMAQVLEKRFKVANSRAKFIASDQTSKMIGNLNQARQSDLGIISYIWQTAEDERVVGNPGGLYPEPTSGHMDHFERNGKTFLWAAPPPDGHPGQAFNCRCVAVAVIPGLQGQTEE